VSQQRKGRHGYDQETLGQMAGAGSPSRSQPDLENIPAQAGGGAVDTALSVPTTNHEEC